MVAKKVSSTKTWARATKSPAVKKAPAQVAANARHIEENAKEIRNNTSMIHLLYGIIIVLLVVIAGLAFYVGTQMWSHSHSWEAPTTTVTEDIVVRIIDDERCTDCQTDAIVGQLKALPFLAGATFIEEDFSDAGVAEYLGSNEIKFLPVVLFNTNVINDGGQITPFLQAIPDESYSLAIGSSFDSFAKRSDKWFLVADDSLIAAIKDDANYIGNENAKITWIEYTDVNCHYCKKMEQEWTVKAVMAAIWEDLNKTSSNYIGVWGQQTQTAAEALECISSLSWADAYNEVLSKVLTGGDNSKATIISLAKAEWTSETDLNTCIDNGDSKETVARKFNRGRNDFWVGGTPGNILINNETGEYQLISGAYSVSTFEEAINTMLQD